MNIKKDFCKILSQMKKSLIIRAWCLINMLSRSNCNLRIKDKEISCFCLKQSIKKMKLEKKVNLRQTVLLRFIKTKRKIFKNLLFKKHFNVLTIRMNMSQMKLKDLAQAKMKMMNQKMIIKDQLKKVWKNKAAFLNWLKKHRFPIKEFTTKTINSRKS